MNLKIKAILVLLFTFLLLNMQNTFSQTYDDAELIIVNNTGNGDGFPITIDVYPVGAIFNGLDQYSPVARYPGSLNNYIYGVYQLPLPNQTNQQYYAKINFDKSEDRENCPFTLGYGKYKIDITGGSQPFSCYVDFSDANYTGTTIPNTYIQQFQIEYLNDGTVRAKYYNASYFQIYDGNTFKVWEQLGTPNPPLTPSKGDFTDSQDPNSQFHSFPLDATNFGHFAHVTPEEVNMSLKIANYDADIIAGSTLIFSDCKFEIESGYNIIVNSSLGYNYMLFTGDEAKFVSYISDIELPEQFYLYFTNGSTIESNGTNFHSDNDKLWGGISIVNSIGKSTIKNCIFTNSNRAFYSENNGSSELIIDNNIFNYSNIYDSYGISITNAENVFIKNNIFNMPTNLNISSSGLDITKTASSEEENNSSLEISINISGNEFYDGLTHLFIYGLSENDLPVFIDNNIFINGRLNMFLKQSTGTVSNNYVYSNNSQFTNILLQYSNQDFLNNYIYGNKYNIEVQISAYPNLSPYMSYGDEVLLIGGLNHLKSIEECNLWGSDFIGFYYTDNGNNSFDINNSYRVHMKAFKFNTYDLDYYSLGNCFYLNGNNSGPLKNIVNFNEDQMNIITGPPPTACTNWDYQIMDRIITDRRNEIFDTVLIARLNNVPPPPQDVTFYGTGVKNQKLKNYSYAISIFKNLINNYPSSKYLEKTIFNLYECYVASDTNHNQGWRNIIFGDLKSFLESKIQQYENNETFVHVAFDFYLKCKIKLKSYQPAMDGYDFIANNSPNALERLIASINYIDVEGLLQGGSGGANLSDDRQKENQVYKDEFYLNQTGKPIKDILLASYKKTRESTKKRDNLELQNSNDAVQTKSIQDRKHQQDKILENRAIENINISSSLTKEERRERIQKDLILLHQRVETSENIIKKNNIELIKYELFQNYPNPFNPITNIKYQIQKAGLVTLKIYDITGREIKTLVNEIKNPGSYIVTFNGSELASGVYFYRIQSGDFVQVKKMVLIK